MAESPFDRQNVDDTAQAASDEIFMARAISVAGHARYSTSPNPGVGCVLVRDGRVIGEGWTQPPGQMHAEIMALNACEDARQSTAYTTLEPCAHTGRTGPCCDALIEAGVSRVVAALQDPFAEVSGRGFARLAEAGVEVAVGCMADQARELHAGFLSRVERGRPWVTVKIAASLDGATALANGHSQWITGSEARADVHRLRAASDVIVTGAGTVVADNPRLNARSDVSDRVTQPRAVVLDSGLRSPANSQVLQRDSLVYTREHTVVGDAVAFEHATLPVDASGGLDLSALLADLSRRSVNTVMVEAGAELSGAFIQSGLADRLVLYQAPRLMGADARGMLDLGGLTRMDQVIDLELLGRQQVGNCSKMTFALTARA